MKTAFLIFSLVSFNLWAVPLELHKEKIINIKVSIPPFWGPPVNGEVLVAHEENFSRVRTNEVYEKISEFIYASNGKEDDGVDPTVGDAVFIDKEKTRGIIDTDLLKATFLPSFNVNGVDQYPVYLKFRASLFQHLFKRVKIEVKKPTTALIWKVFYEIQEIDGLDIAINGVGKVLKLNLLLGQTIVKSLDVNQLETIPESQF